MQIGLFPVHDFYGDGLLYLLDTPDHWPEHMCSLARTTPDVLVFLGGDICHFAKDFRPSEGLPLPDNIPKGAFGGDVDKVTRSSKYPMPCLCAFFTVHHPQLDNPAIPQASLWPRETPFYKLSTHPHTSYKDSPLAPNTLQTMRDSFDS